MGYTLPHMPDMCWYGLPDLARFATYYSVFSAGIPSGAELRVQWRKLIANQVRRVLHFDRFVLLNRKCGISLDQFLSMTYTETEALLQSATHLDNLIKEELNRQKSLNDLLDKYNPNSSRSSSTFNETVQSSPFNSLMNRIKTNPLSILQ